MNIRKSVRNLSDKELGKLRDAYDRMMKIRDNRGFNHIAGFHGIPDWYCWHHQLNQRSQLRVRLFLPWHRAYLHRFEQAVQDQVEDVTIPWWDWTSKKSRSEGIPKAFTARTFDGKPNPLYKSHMYVPTANPPLDRDTVRAPGTPTDLPTPETIDNLLELNDFGDFSDGLEDVHDSIHVWVGGDMAQIPFAAFDPIFYSHHTMIDRVWWLWQLRHGNSGILSLSNEVLAPFNLKVSDVLKIYDLGYDYAGAKASSTTGG
jgi:tyrosinase